VVGSHILILGLTFKENCPDIRNTRVVDIVQELRHYNAHVHVYDPWADLHEVEQEYGFKLVDRLYERYYDAIILAVAHSQFKKWKEEDLRRHGKELSVVYDVKHLFDRSWVDGRL
jgi:UDP-N-acetyl-D-galactosamine dehydrogenase